MPPSIKRLEPPKPAAIALPPGSMLANAVPVANLREKHVKLCLYGRNRSGKTTLAAQFKKPILFISSEPDANGGATSISNIEGIHLQRVSDKLLGQDRTGNWVNATDPSCVRRDTVSGSTKMVYLANELAEAHPFATVVLDTVTSLQDIVLVELMKLPKVPEMNSWGMVPDGMYQQRSDKLRETIRPFLDLQNCNLVVIAQEKDHNAQEDRGGKNKLIGTMQMGSFLAPALGPTNAKWLQDACGYVIQVYEDEIMQQVVVPMGEGQPPMIQQVGTGKRQRHLRMLYHPNFAAGGRWQYDPNTPEFVTAPSPKELYEAMAKYIPSLKI